MVIGCDCYKLKLSEAWTDREPF